MKLDQMFGGVAGQNLTMSLRETQSECGRTRTTQLHPSDETKRVLSTMKGMAAEKGYDFRAHFPGGCYPSDIGISGEYKKNRANAHIDIIDGKWQIGSFSFG